MAHLWSGRFAGDPDAELFAFGSSFRFDKRLFEDDVTGSLAWAQGLGGGGVLVAAAAGGAGGGRARGGGLSGADPAGIDGGLRAILARAASDPAFVNDGHGDEDVHAFVE